MTRLHWASILGGMSALILLVILVIAGEVRTDSMADGYVAYQHRDYPAAFRLFESAAKGGNAKAMNYLGELYATGKGVPRDFGRAVEWFRAGAQGNEPDAENNLGEMYANGWGVVLDHQQAKEWFSKAAQQGSPAGNYNLGRMLLIGTGVTHDAAKAAEHLERAVKSAPADPRHRNWLGSAYFEQGQFREAEEEFRAVLNSGGKPADVWNWYWGMSLLKLDRIDEAYDAFERARTEDAAHNRGIDHRSDAADQIRQIEGYRAHYRNAMQAISARELGKAKEEFGAALALEQTQDARQHLAAIEGNIKASRLHFVLTAAGVALVILVLGIVVLVKRHRHALALAAGDMLGATIQDRYELKEVIGEGGMGRVYMAMDRQGNQKVAAKRMRTEMKSWSDARERFLGEAKAIARLKHENIVGIQTVVEQNGETFIILNFVEGEPLSAILGRKSRLPLEECRETIRQVCSAVGFAHDNGVVHRDLKPSNIMIEPSGRALVMDFGLAREIKDTLSRMTSTQATGTPVYMAPEQHLGKVCRQSDIFALGATLYEMLTGEHPFHGPDYLSQKERMLFQKASQLVAGLPMEIDSLLASALDAEPKKRPATAMQFADWLARING